MKIIKKFVSIILGMTLILANYSVIDAAVIKNIDVTQMSTEEYLKYCGVELKNTDEVEIVALGLSNEKSALKNSSETAIKIRGKNADGTVYNGLLISMSVKNSGLEKVNPRVTNSSIRKSKLFSSLDAGPDIAVYVQTIADSSTLDVPYYRPISVSISYTYMNYSAFVSNLRIVYETVGWVYHENGGSLVEVTSGTAISGLEWSDVDGQGSCLIDYTVTTPSENQTYTKTTSFPSGYYIKADGGFFGNSYINLYGTINSTSGGTYDIYDYTRFFY